MCVAQAVQPEVGPWYRIASRGMVTSLLENQM